MSDGYSQPAQLAAKGDPMNLPNLLTALRLGCIPVILAVFYFAGSTRLHIVAAIFALASATDFIDGYVARRREQVTNLGKLLDPVADKLLVTTGLVLLTEVGRVWSWIAILIIGREIAVTGLRAMASANGLVLPAEGMGKLKMIFQVIGVTILFVADRADWFWLWVVGLSILLLSLLFALLSGGRYLQQLRHLLKHDPQ